MFKLRKWFMGFILAAVAIFLVACKDTPDNGGKEKEPEKTSVEIVQEAMSFLKENLPVKVIGDFEIPVFENEEVEVIITPRNSVIKDGVWIYNKPYNDYKETFDIVLGHGDYKTEFRHVFEVYGISDFDKFALADAELQKWFEIVGVDVTENLELPESAANLDILWVTNNKEVIKANGEYIRPNDDTKVNLTAIFSSGEVNYQKILTFTAKGFTKEEKIEHFKTVDIPHLVNGESSVSVSLPSKMSRFDFQIEWKSSNPDVLGHDGKFKNPENDTPITLQATLRYRMTLVDPNDPTKGYRPLGETSFEETIEIPFTVKALATELDRAAYDASENEAKAIPEHFYFGKVEDNKIKDLPTTVAGYEGFTISYLSKDGSFTYNAEENTLELTIQPLLYKQTFITMVVTDGTNSKEVEVPVNIGLLEKHQIGISVVSDVSQWLDLEKYNATNGFGNQFDGGANIPTRDFTWNGLVFKSTFKWYHEDPEVNPNAGYTETDFFFFFRHNAVISIKEADLELVEGEEDVYTSKALSAKHSGSYLKVVHNSTDKDVVVKGSDLKTKFGLQQHNLYQLYIYDGEGNQTLAVPGTDEEATYEIPAGGYLIERGYIDNAASNAYFSQAKKVEFITVKRHSVYGG